mmetsp:Transcript_35383/g.38283  ORF Transcript_35383/g.38283 Transcript_35383/m.38283 type:complete len:378 (+) Transcript_35383:92-1225(+)
MYVSKTIINSVGRKSSIVVSRMGVYSLRISRFSTPSTSRASLSSIADGSGFDKIGCVGLGLMGHGICQVAATSGIHSKIIAFEQEQRFLDSGNERIIKSIDKLVEKGKMTLDNANDAMGKIEFTTNVDALSDADFIVEAVVENIDLKKDLYTTLGNICRPETIFASNTSSLSIGEMAAFSGRPDKFLGVHFFNPVQVNFPHFRKLAIYSLRGKRKCARWCLICQFFVASQIMKVVEVIKTDETDPVVLEKGLKWVEEIGKVSVVCDDTPGFIVNRILVPMLMQSMTLIDRQVASVKDVDAAMKLGCGHPMGPLHLADYIGLDTCYFIVKGWMEKYPNESDFFIPACLQVMVEAGNLGRKTGKGFYHWEGEKVGDPVE